MAVCRSQRRRLALVREPDNDILAALMGGVPPLQVAGELVTSWLEFEREAWTAGADAGAVSAVYRTVYVPRIDAILAWLP